MRASRQDQECGEHGTSEFLSETAPDEANSVGIVGDFRVLELDQADEVAGVDGDETKTDSDEHTRYETKCRKCRRNTERAESNGLHDHADGETLPAEAVVLLLALLDGRGDAELIVVFEAHLAVLGVLATVLVPSRVQRSLLRGIHLHGMRYGVGCGVGVFVCQDAARRGTRKQGKKTQTRDL